MLRVINVNSDTNIAGAGKMMLTFLKSSDRSKFDHLVVIPEKSLLAPELSSLGVKYVQLSKIGEKSFSVSSVSEFCKLFKQYKPDIVHTHASLSARLAARIYGKCKIIYTRHSVFDLPRSSKSFPIKQISGFINNRLSDAIIAVSPAARTNLIETGVSSSKIRVVFNGVDKAEKLTDEMKDWVLAEYGLRHSDFVCAVIARLEAVKGHQYLIEAAEKLKKYRDIKMIIAGTGSLERYLKNKVSDLGLDNCIFTGFVREIQKIENIMTIQICASYGSEATSLSLLEGMSLGVPAIASDFGGNPYVISNGENGLIVPRKNSDALADAILKLYTDKKLYEKMSVNAKKIFDKRFTSKIMVREIEDIYLSL